MACLEHGKTGILLFVSMSTPHTMSFGSITVDSAERTTFPFKH